MSTHEFCFVCNPAFLYSPHPVRRESHSLARNWKARGYELHHLLVYAQLEQHLLERFARQRDPNPLSSLCTTLSTLVVAVLVLVIIIIIVNAFHLVRSGVGTPDDAVVFKLGQEPVDLIRVGGDQGIRRLFFEPVSSRVRDDEQGTVSKQVESEGS